MLRRWLVRIGGVFVLLLGAILWVYGMVERASRAAKGEQRRDDALAAADAKRRADEARIRTEPARDLQDELTKPL